MLSLKMAAPPPSEDEIMEEREELMASAIGGGIPQLRKAHFLKPIVPSIKASNLKLPHLSPKSRWPLHVDFNGWRDPQKKWEKWVDQMQSKHQSLWKKAGIFEAIMCSKYRFHRNDDLFFGMVERWCSETNTFVFPWGEATITLEDLMILGGFSVLGSPVLLPVSEKELVEIEMSLRKLHNNFVRMKRHSHLKWLSFFMESGRRYEHEAFLSLWLSRFVFPGNEFDQIGEHVFPMAVHLARGMKIALAPAVLAFIYRDLSLLKESMAASRNLEEDGSGEGSILAVSLWAPLQFVQLWAWERFLMFQPEPNFLSFGDPRAARWHDVKRPDIGNVRPIIDSCGDIFLWRPYTLALDQWKFPEFYKEIEQWVDIGKCPDEALESFARFLRACVLVGIDCEEPYQPHRVAMQFGLDQDIPELVRRSIESPEVAWINYSKPLNYGARLYLPARLFESDLSVQYQHWWRKKVLVPVESFRGVLQGQRSSRIKHRGRDLGTSIKQRIEVESNDTGLFRIRNHTPIVRMQSSAMKQIKREYNDVDVPPGFPPKFNHPPTIRPETFSKQQAKQKDNDANVLPGFPPKTNHGLSMRPELSTKLQTKGNDAHVTPGFPPKKSPAPMTNLDTSTKLQTKMKGNDADIPPVFLPKYNQNPIQRPKTPINQLKRSVDLDLTVVPPSFPSKHNHSPFMRPETCTTQPKKEVFGLDLPSAFPPEFNILSEQNQSPKGKLQHCNNHQNSNSNAANELKSSLTFQIQGKSSSAAAAAIGNLQPEESTKINTGNVASTGHAYKIKDENSVHNCITINENGGDSNCTFKFDSQILANIQACMNRVKSDLGD
ncbi:hypothetical protein ACH5RR_037925 [Cinchona calisaya]|uniref:Aminotransferase-like plant mobile domain-containing protein n=1 Tax=Cinchona calisaya TaxID=153742 RepID=A0ABD2Y8Y1_9GENT